MSGTVLAVILTALGAYLAGSVPFGFLIGKYKGIDIRTQGSGNIGATNVTRVIGKSWGRFCFALDFLKGALPVLIIRILSGYGIVQDPYGILLCIAVFFPVCGHMWPCWLKFKGGKGVSTAAGAILILAPLPLLAALVLWIVIFYAFRYVSLASICAAAALPVFAWLNNVSGIGFCPAGTAEMILLTVLAVLTIVKHISNIKRLCNGTENRFVKKSNNEVQK